MRTSSRSFGRVVGLLWMSLSELRLLHLDGDFTVSLWDVLASRTTLLTALSLSISESPPSSTITASRLFSAHIPTFSNSPCPVALPQMISMGPYFKCRYTTQNSSLWGGGGFHRLVGLACNRQKDCSARCPTSNYCTSPIQSCLKGSCNQT